MSYNFYSSRGMRDIALIQVQLPFGFGEEISEDKGRTYRIV